MMPSQFDLAPLSIDLMLAAATLFVFLMDLAMPHGQKRWVGMLTAALLGLVLTATFFVDTNGTCLWGAYVGGPWPLMLKRVALVAGILASLGGLDHVDRHFPHRQGEYSLLLMFSMLGMTLLPGARDFILLMVCFELMGIPLSMMAAYGKSDGKGGLNAHSAEAGLKLYLVSAASTAITLFGLSLVYGLSGDTRFEAVTHTTMSPLLGVGMFLTLAGMSFKVGLVPFHMWIPDTYQGASTPFVAFLSVAPKATGFAALTAALLFAFRTNTHAVMQVVLLLVVASVVIGNLMAAPQQDVKRLLAYSGIAQVGYMLMGLLASGSGTWAEAPYGTGMLLFYLAGYVVTNMGAFLVLEAAYPDQGSVTIADLNGLSRRAPWLALALLLFLLSLAGIPFVVGFWAKLYVFMAVYKAGLGWLVLFGAMMAIVALWYYLQVAKAVYMVAPKDESRLTVKPALAAAIAFCLLAVVGMGAWPRPFVESAADAARAFFGVR